MTNKGNLIAELRREAGFTQKSLAEALHITDKAISKWERGLSKPDTALLPKLSLLLHADLELLLGEKHKNRAWEGLIDLRGFSVNLEQKIYDKPMVYYLLSHYLLLGIQKVAILTSEQNRAYLSKPFFSEIGFSISDRIPDETDLMILNRPAFLFGSDLTRQFQWAMAAESLICLGPEYGRDPFLFCPAECTEIYQQNPKRLYDAATKKTLGRGIICMDMDNVDSVMEVSNFIRMYQANTDVLIGSLEEISFRKGYLPFESLIRMSEFLSYGTYLRDLAEK